MAVSIIVGISILRINPSVTSRPWLRNLLGIIYILAIPVMGALIALFVYRESFTSV